MTRATATIPPIPAPLHWDVPPSDWSLDQNQTLRIVAGGTTDLFCDPAGGPAALNAPRLLFTPHPDFTLGARVAVDFAATYDAGVLLLYASDQVWAKLCYELSPQHRPMIVSVVTRGQSDDCNSQVVEGGAVFLRVSRFRGVFAFHFSEDGTYWHLVRYFTLPQPDQIMVGFSAQSPTGSVCGASFETIRYVPSGVEDIRSGL